MGFGITAIAPDSFAWRAEQSVASRIKTLELHATTTLGHVAQQKIRVSAHDFQIEIFMARMFVGHPRRQDQRFDSVLHEDVRVRARPIPPQRKQQAGEFCSPLNASNEFRFRRDIQDWISTNDLQLIIRQQDVPAIPHGIALSPS